MIRNLWRWSALAVLALAAVVLSTRSAGAASDPWSKGAQWMSIRAGYAKETGQTLGHGGVGYGFGYSRMMTQHWSLGAYAHHELLSVSGAASLMVFPFTVEAARHFRWQPYLYPYLGVGGGGFNYRSYRTGDDRARAMTTGYLVGGMNTLIDQHQLLGVDVRMAFLRGQTDVDNPVFGPEKSVSLGFSAKLNWSFCY